MKCYPFYPIKVRIREMLEPIAGRPAPSKKGDRDSGIALRKRKNAERAWNNTKGQKKEGGGGREKVELARKNQ